MKEIKARAWVRDDMLTNEYLIFKGYSPLTAITLNDSPFVWMLGSGVKDKNNKEIYDGDICDSVDGRFTVGFEDGCFWVTFIDDDGGAPLYVYSDNTDLTTDINCEVIGNIYQHRHLKEIKEQ